MLDATVVNVALARIGTRVRRRASPRCSGSSTRYTLTLAALILLGGVLGDRFGRRRIFLVGVVWFAVASALCALSPNAGVLIAARALQGVGGALLTPGSLAIISSTFAVADRPRAVGPWAGLGGLAGAVGPFLGGWLVAWSWRLVFLINLPLAALVVLVALRHVPETRDPESDRRPARPARHRARGAGPGRADLGAHRGRPARLGRRRARRRRRRAAGRRPRSCWSNGAPPLR